MRDWTGSKQSIFRTLGASNHSLTERQEHDFYATDPIAIDKLNEVFCIPREIYEPACGNGWLSKRLKDIGHDVYSTDLYDRGYGDCVGIDFLQLDELPTFLKDYSILTNPPYKYAKEFVLKALDLVAIGNYVMMFLKIQFLEGKARYNELFSKYPPQQVIVSSERMACARDGNQDFLKSSAVAYAWFIWQKGNYDETTLRWM